MAEQTTETKPVNQRKTSSRSGSSGLSVVDRYRIQPGKRLPEFDAGLAKAYVAEDSIDTDNQVYCLITPVTNMIRIDITSNLMEIQSNGVLGFLDWDYLIWPETKSLCYALVVECPKGRALLDPTKPKAAGMNEETIKRVVVRSLLPALKGLQEAGVTHRNIRPNNIFYDDVREKAVVLGECISNPPALAQPGLYETIESMMALPEGRGDGTFADDMYALGVSILVLYLGKNPLKDLDDVAILQKKLTNGTYNTLIGNYRFPESMDDLFRGLLTDNRRDRWQLRDLEKWLVGTYAPPKQPRIQSLTGRPFTFANKDYNNLRALAWAFNRSHQSSGEVIGSSSFKQWYERAVRDKHFIETMDTLRENYARPGQDIIFKEDQVAQICIRMDSDAPLQFRGVGVMPSGVVSAMLANLDNFEQRQALAEMIQKRLMTDWVNANPELAPDLLRRMPKLMSLGQFFERKRIGYGLERALYEMNANIPCLSPLLKGMNTIGLDNTLQSLETVAANVDRSTFPIDAHLAAYFATHCSFVNDRLLYDISPTSPDFMRDLGALKIINYVQRYVQTGPLPNLTLWLGSKMEGVIDSYHNVKRRKRLKKDLKIAMKTNQLKDLLKVVDNETERRLDEQQFTAAKNYYNALAREMERLQNNKTRRTELAQMMGGQIAANVSVVVATLILAMYFFFNFMR